MTPADLTPQTSQTPEPLDPDTVHFTQKLLDHAHKAGFTREQMHAALRDPRWINTVRSQPPTHMQRKTRYRYCGHGVAVIIEGLTAIAVIPDNLDKEPAAHVA